MVEVVEMSPARACTEGRRTVIYESLVALGKPSTAGEVLAFIEAHRLKDWPQATWSHARNDPYYLGIAQNLKAMARRGDVTDQRGDFTAVIPRPQPPTPKAKEQKPPRPSMRARAQEALDLKNNEGLNGKQIAERMGISYSYAYVLINDPTGERERQRKQRYCKSCGGIKDDASRCEPCHEKRAHALLPPLHFARYIHLAANVGVRVAFGVTDDYKRVVRQGTGRGFTEYVLADDERWEEAVFTLGFETRETRRSRA